MIQVLDIFNVGFGDCFVCKNDSAALLVDCGHIKNGSVATAINASLMTVEQRYLMITHFHNDHLAGISKLSPCKFDEIFLPDFYNLNIINLEFQILASMNHAGKHYKIAHDLLSFIPSIENYLKYDTKISFVRQGTDIENPLGKIRVLWPSQNCKEIATSLLERMKISELVSRLANEYYNILSQIIEVIREEPEGETQIIKNELKRLNGLIKKAEQINEDSPKGDRVKNRILASDITKFQNQICLCFDQLGEGNEESGNVLFLSDIPNREFEEFRPQLFASYKLIKAPHHGTKDYVIHDLPNSQTMVFTNSKNKNWDLSAMYGIEYWKANFICTNCGGCEFHMAGTKRCDDLGIHKTKLCSIPIMHTLKL